MELHGNFRLKCKKCQHVHSFAPDDVVFESETMDSGQMGNAYGHHWEHDFDCNENGCPNHIEIAYEVIEYPIGALETDEIKIDGGDVVEKFTYEFTTEPDRDDY